MTAHEYRLLRLWQSIGVAGCAILFYMCVMPSPPSINVNHADKIEHFVAYLLLGTWFAGILAPRYLAVLAGLVAFGAAIEVVQAFIGYRDAEFYDLLADLLGILAGIGLARIGAMSWLRYIDRRVAAKRDSAG